MSSPQINACSSINLPINLYARIALKTPIIGSNSIRSSFCITKGFIRTNHRQRASVNHATSTHNHALGGQKVQITANFIIAHSINSTANANLAFHSIHQSIERKSISTSLEI